MEVQYKITQTHPQEQQLIALKSNWLEIIMKTDSINYNKILCKTKRF